MVLIIQPWGIKFCTSIIRLKLEKMLNTDICLNELITKKAYRQLLYRVPSEVFVHFGADVSITAVFVKSR